MAPCVPPGESRENAGTMKHLKLAALILPFALSTGCIYRVVPGKSYGSGGGALSSGGGQPQCKPSQYWDGNMCRHKGQGSGARKHDG